MSNKKKVLVTILTVILLIFLLFFSLKIPNHYPQNISLKYAPGTFGVTFSTEFCSELGLNWKDTYQAILTDLQVKYIRLPFYWDQIEVTQGHYDFSDFDYLVNEASKHNAKVIITMGRRVPRWPECHTPEWTNSQAETTKQAEIIKLIKTIVEHYKNNPDVIYWQVENEPFLGTFGTCPPLDENFLKKEFATVRALDSRPIIITGSGELSSWQQESKIGDIFGTTMYRVVYNSWLGYIHYPIPGWFYELKARLAGLIPGRFMIMELQAEPWVARGQMAYISEADINQTKRLDQFKANVQYALDIHAKQIYLWGVEWWYWQKLYGNPEYWETAKTLFK
jgi:hypothetical protein